MNYELFDYQEAAKATVLKALTRQNEAYLEDPHERGAVSLAAPTGAGKTVIATAVIEVALDGDDTTSGIPGATFLWVTDDPALNRQTLNKMVAASSSLGLNRLIPIESDFHQKTFDDGCVYFLNIQKLRAGAMLSKSGVDGREYSLWQTIANTVRDRPGGLFVVIDEAHRGMNKTRTERDTIVSRILGDAANGQPEVPVVLGISAVPRRFRDEMDRRGRNIRSYVVPINDVRESGLLKDQIILGHTKGVDAAESTLVRHGVTKVLEYQEAWFNYCQANGEPIVEPILVVQVGDKPSASELGDLANTIFEEWPDITAANVVHTFASHAPESAGANTIAYCPPEDIQDRADVRVVLCKTAITTGWDCPRAEVLVSMRVARDADLITQVMGRMVRSPLARRISSDENLNTVHCVLPKFDATAVNDIAQKFQKGDDDNMASGTDVILNPIQLTRNSIFLKESTSVTALAEDEDTSWFGGDDEEARSSRGSVFSTPTPGKSLGPAPAFLPGQSDLLDQPELQKVVAQGADDVFGLIASLPSYTIPTRSFRQPTARLFSLATLLAAKYDGKALEGIAIVQARNALLAEIQTHQANLEAKGLFDAMLDAAATTSLYERIVAYADESKAASDVVTSLDIDNRGIAILMDRARKTFPEGLTNLYVDNASPDDADVTDSMLAVIALSRDTELPGLIQQRASDLVAQWLQKYASAVSRLGPADRERFDRIRRESDRPLLTSFNIPDAKTEDANGKAWERHLLAGPDGLFRVNLREWEEYVLQEELDHGAVAWYRNPPKGMHALQIPYTSANGIKGMSPDFIFIHTVNGELRASLIDPHGIHLSDAVPKLKGMSLYAGGHSGDCNRIQSIAKIDRQYRMLNMQEPDVQKGIEEYTGQEASELFRDFGANY